MADAPMATPDMESADEQSADNSPEEQDETGTLPIDFCPGMTPKEGDEFKVKVVSVDQDNGTISVAYVPSMKPKAGIKNAAAQFDGGGM